MLHDESASVTAAELPSRQRSIAWGSQIDAAADKATWPGFSEASLVQLPGQLLSLSHGVISFGPVSIQGTSKRIVALTAGTEYGIEFEWSLEVLAREHQLLDCSLQIQPSSGKLEPNGCCLCRLTFTAGLNSQLFEAGIKCRVTALAQPPSPLQPTRVPSINSPLNSPRTIAGATSQAESSKPVAGNLSAAQHGRRSPRMSSSPRKGPRADSGLAGAPVRQGSLGSPTKDKAQSSPSRALASQNRAPISRTSSSVSSSAGQQGMSPQKSSPRATVRSGKAASPAKAGGKASGAAPTGKTSSPKGSGVKPSVKSPHKARRESGQHRHFACVSVTLAEHPAH